MNGNARTLGLAGIAGVSLDQNQYVRALTRYAEMIDAQIAQDCATLGYTGTLPEIKPPPPPGTRAPAGPFASAAMGAIATGAIFGLLTTVVVILAMGASGGNPVQGIIGGVFLGFVVAVITTFVPGMIVGFIMQRRAAGRQYAQQAHAFLMMFHQGREAIRHDLLAGQVDAYTAAQQLTALMDRE